MFFILQHKLGEVFGDIVILSCFICTVVELDKKPGGVTGGALWRRVAYGVRVCGMCCTRVLHTVHGARNACQAAMQRFLGLECRLGMV